MNRNKSKFKLAVLAAITGAILAPGFANAMTLEEALAKHKQEQQSESLSNGFTIGDSNSDQNESSSDYSNSAVVNNAENNTSNGDNTKLAAGYTPVKLATGETIYLSDAERALINTKRDIILQQLLEQEKLKAARSHLAKEEKVKAFNNAIAAQFQLTPAQIKEIKERSLAISQAQNAPVKEAKLNIRTINIDVDAPKPITVQVHNGYASSIVFYDQAGNPWPIEGDVIGDPKNFTKKIATPDHNIAVFDIQQDFHQSNALVNLKGLNLPIVLKLTGTSDQVDARLVIRLPRLGPNSQGLITTADNKQKVTQLTPVLMNVLNGDLPVGSVRYDVKGVDNTSALLINHKMYIRTTNNLLSPPPISSAKSPTGYSAYEIYPVNKLLFSEAGELKNATIAKAVDVKIRHKTVVFD